MTPNQPSQDLFHFCSMIPKVKKSIKKYKQKFNVQFLNIISNSSAPQNSPPKFLQPLKIYRFYTDYVGIDNPSTFTDEERINQISLYLNFKTISQITLGKTLKIELQDMFSEWSSIALYCDRLNSLGNQDSHQLAETLLKLKEIKRFKEIPNDCITNEDIFKFNLNLKKTLSKNEMKQYRSMISNSRRYMSQNEKNYVFKFKKIFNKTEPFCNLGFILNEIEFNKKCVNLFINKDFEKITYDNILDLFKITSINKDHYFEFLNGILNALSQSSEVVNAGIRTSENIYIPCQERFKTYFFKGNKYEEMHVYVIYTIDDKHIENLNVLRLENQKEDADNLNVEKAKIKSKYKKIKNVGCNSLKALCLLYYADKDDENDENENIEIAENDDYAIKSKEFWENIDESKVCK